MSNSKILFALSCLGMIVGCSAGASEENTHEPAGTATAAEALAGGRRVNVIEATYGANCGAPRSNATWSVVQSCDGTKNCAYRVSSGTLGDPKPGCDKNFDVRWACGRRGNLSAHVNGEANGQTVTLDCANIPPMRGAIRVTEATFGGNLGQPANNALWDVAPSCDGYGMCRYFISTGFLGDPAPGYDKDFFVRWTCSNHGATVFQAYASPEASGKSVTLDCP